jgi:AraC family transcriptional regulator
VILRQMPDLAPGLFHDWFYQHWGRENCVISARTRYAEYPPYQQRLSIKAAWGGTEDYFIDHRRVAVDDDTFMILNDGRTYASHLRNRTPVTSFSIFFRPGMAEDVARVHASTPEALLADPRDDTPGSIEFSECVRVHDRLITPVLRFIRGHVERGLIDEAWYEDQLYFLLRRMQVLHRNDLAAAQLIPTRRASTRRELVRRLGWCADFINTHYRSQVSLAEMAAAAHLSPYHCLRAFKALHGNTPATYLNNRRLRAAERLLRNTDLPVGEVAVRVGFESRITLFRQMKRVHGVAPSALRTAVAEREDLRVQRRAATR